MPSALSDTHPRIAALQIELMRSMPPWKKLAMVADLNSAVRQLAVAGIRLRHPEADAQQVRRMLADLMLGEQLASKVYARGK
jgi:hypothetical protein